MRIHHHCRPLALSTLCLFACGDSSAVDTSGGPGGTATATIGTGTESGGDATTAPTSGATVASATATATESTAGETGNETTAGTGEDTTTGTPGDEVTMYEVEPGVLSSDVMPGFCEPELYAKRVDGKTEYWLRDNVAAYADPRPRSFYVDYGYVGPTLDYGPILRGGVYSVRCLRFAGDQWWKEPGTIESHVVWFRVPGPMMEAGEVQVPASFQIEDNFIYDQSKLLPEFTAIDGEIALAYRFREKDTLADIYGHGATHIVAAGNPGEMDPAKLGVTTAMEVNAPWMAQLGVNPQPTNLDALGEVIFRDLSDAQQDEAIAQQAPIGIYFTDLEKSPGYGDPKTYWSINLEDATLPRYYRLLKKMREVAPGRIVSDYYRAIVWTKGFNSPGDGNPDPLDPSFAKRLSEPEAYGTSPAYRKFAMDGQNVSLRDVIDIFTIDAYPGRGFGPFDGSPDKSDRSWTSYQLYSMIFDTMVARKVVPASAKIVWFGWSQSDNDVLTRLYIKLPTGRASYLVRHPQPAAWAETVEMLGYIVGDGYHWWTEQVARGDDPQKLGTGDGDPKWEPNEPNTPAPWTWSDNPNGDGAYPRMHEYALSYGKLGHYRVKQIEDRLGAWSFAPYTLADTPGSVPVGEATILQLAADRLPIVLLIGEPGKRAVFAVHPFGDFRKRYELSVDVDGTPTPVTISGKWPTLVKL